MSRTAIRRALLSVALVVPTVVVAQKPAAQAVFDKYTAAVGGLPAFRALTARTESGTADITFAGVSAGYERKVAGGRMLTVIDVAGFGQVLSGFDGTTSWSMNPQAGAAKGAPGETAEIAAALTPTSGHWESGSYTSAEVLDAADFEGTKVWPVKIVTKSGRNRTVYYDQVTGLKVGELVTGETGELKVIYADYKPFGAVKLPTKVTQATPQGDVILNITAVKFDPIDAAVFALPDAVKALP